MYGRRSIEVVNPEKLFKLSEKVSKLTRLFAEENLHVSFMQNADTACFMPATRTLQFPYNFMMLSDDDIMMLFLTHEVGHAFWSSLDLVKKANDQSMSEYVNIVEDIRVERKLKEKYPGLVGTFLRGYKKLYDDGFFRSPESHPFMKFSNRLNIYAKCGPITSKNINFSEEEIEFIKECFAAETEDDVIDLAKELKDMDRGSVDVSLVTDDFLRKFIGTMQEDEDEDTEDYPEIDGSEIQNTPNGEDEDDSEITEEQRDIMLDKLMRQMESLDLQFEMEAKIKRANAKGASFTVYESMPRFKDEYYTFKDFIAGGYAPRYQGHAPTARGTFRQNLTKFLNSISRSVAYMAQEFELKKAAARYKNAKISTSGKIDLNQVHKFKYDDKIFANRMIFKDDKRHGMVIMLDGSGSICRMYQNMIKQVVLLTEYARKIGVPYKVFMFGSVMKVAEGHQYKAGVPEFKNSVLAYDISMQRAPDFYEVLSSDMSREEYHDALELLMFHKVSFGGTPTAASMCRLEGIANDFFNMHRVTNKKVFVVTDGQPTDANSYLNSYVLVDPVTEKTYRTNAAASYTPISMIGSIWKDRYDIDLVSIVLSNSRRELADFISSDSKEFADATSDKGFTRNKFVKTKDTMGLPIFAIKPINAEVDLNLDAIDGDMSVAAAANRLQRAMSKMQVSQVMLQALSEEFAV